MKTVTSAQLPALFEQVAEKMTEKEQTLCEMDAKLGDGDLGLTMRKGFSALPDILRASEEHDMGKILIKTGTKLATVVPSTMGTLMASGIMNGGLAILGEKEMDANIFCRYLHGFIQGIEKRGKCKKGDRTILDAMAQAEEELLQALKQEPAISLIQAGRIAAEGARRGTQATCKMKPKFGKAAIHVKEAVGVPDQGACAGMYMLEGFRDYFERSE